MSTITSKSATPKVTVYIGHAAPTIPKTDEIVGFAYDMTVTYGNGKSYRYYRNTPVKGKTGNQLELLAMVFALKVLKQPSTVTFVTDSKYILDTFGKLRKYIQAGWKTRTGSEVANKEGWQCLIEVAKKGGNHFAVEKAEGIAVYQVSNCHLEAKKAINLRLMAELQPKAKAVPAPEAKAISSMSAKAEPAPKAAQPAKEQPAPDVSSFDIPDIPELPASARDDIPRDTLEQLLAAALVDKLSSPGGSEVPELPADAELKKCFSKDELFLLNLQKKAKERFK